MLVSLRKKKEWQKFMEGWENSREWKSRKKVKIDILKLKNSILDTNYTTGGFDSILDTQESRRIPSSINAKTNTTDNKKALYHGTF